MIFHLTQEQFILFIEYVWGFELPPEWRSKHFCKFWGEIAAYEAGREFEVEGYPFDGRSELTMAAEGDREITWEWEETPGGTKVRATQSRCSEKRMAGPIFEVEIPNDQCDEMGEHFRYLQAVLAGVPYSTLYPRVERNS